MKKEIKKLYKKDKNLAIEVAKVFNMKIVKSEQSDVNNLKKEFNNVFKDYIKFSSSVNEYNKLVKDIIKKLPDPIGYGNIWKSFMQEFETNFKKYMKENIEALRKM